MAISEVEIAEKMLGFMESGWTFEYDNKDIWMSTKIPGLFLKHLRELMMSRQVETNHARLTARGWQIKLFENDL